MFRPAKTRVGLIFTKAVACVAAYGFVATSVWAASLTGPQAGSLSSARYVPNALANAPLAMLQAGGGGIVSSISSNFNATAIPAGDKIWFTAVMKLNGTVPRSPVSIAVHHSTIQFIAGGINYSLNVPDSVVTFSPGTTTSTATFDTANNAQPVWLGSQLNPQPSGNTLLQAFAYPVPAGGLPGGIKNVTWTSSFSSDTANITLNWQWAAGVYTGCVSSAYNSDNVKPTDDNSASIYKNADHAGTPEACKSFVTQGATGGGASNYTGSLSGTASVTPPLAVATPTVTSTLSPPPNGNGWNNTNVTVSFSCSDANFAIASCPQPVTVSSEGAGQVITGTAVDQAGGGAAVSTSVTINLDKSSPSITATATSSSGNSTVLTLPVTVTFTCADGVSGVDSCPAPIQVTSPGANEIFSGTVTDKAGNTASTSIALNTQSSPLAITRSISPAPINGWNKTDVTISYQCTGGVPPVQCPQPAIVSAEGAGQVISATATDSMGQSSTIATTLNIDKTVPVISAAAAPPPNEAGWNTEDVTITYTCSDSLSGVGACPQPQVVSIEGKAQQISSSVSDVAGNTASATTTINLEKTAPLISGTVTPAPNAAGWNNSDVTVSFTCTPSVSDIVSCPSPVLATEGTGQEISGTVTDQAGKSNNTTITVNVDKTPPLISAVLSPQPNAAGWNNTPVTVTFTCSDAGSGIAACSDPVLVSAEGVNQVVIGTAMDKAGNIVQMPVTLKIDTTPPVITATPEPLPNAAGWNTTPVTITYACSDTLSAVAVCPAPQVASSEGKAQQFTASVTDQAGNTTSSVVLLNIETTAPSITALLTPSPNAAGWNNTDVTVGFNCTPSASDIVSCQPPVVVSAEGKAQSITGTVTDQAGKSATATAIVNLDKTTPLISASAAPPANAAGWNNTDVTITYLCSDSLSGIALCPSPTAVSSEGAAETFSAQVVDQAGNVSTVSTTLNIDKTPPIVTAVTAPPANGAGWNNTDVTVTYSCSDGLSGVASCPSTAVISSEGQNQSVPSQARDVAGNVGTAAVTVSIDKTAPTIIQITAPDHISRLHGGQVSVTVNDNFSVSQVVISANDTPLGTFSAAPYQVDLQVPPTANPGDTVTVTVLATDAAGNTQTSSRGVRVAADGVVVGQVLSDVTSFPIPGAVVQAITKASLSDQTNDHGRYSLQVSDSHLFVTAMSAAPATTTVEREVFVQEGVGTVPVDARLTPLASPVAIGSAGGTLAAGNISIAVPAGAVGDGTSFQLTPLSGQGLPGLLPLGWSPVAAFDLRATSSAVNLPASFSKLPNVIGSLVLYNPALHAWTIVASNLQVINGGLTLVLPAPASYALVVPDLTNPPIVIPAPGDPLTGIDVQQLSPQASSSGALSPATLPPSGGTSTATLGVQSVTYVPSGTVIQANVSEKFSLKSGSLVSDEIRSEDIVLYGALAPTGSSLGAQFPVAPSHKFANTELLTGEVHLDILAGREGVRGQPGGSDPLTLSDGTSTLFVPGGALNEDTAISIQSIALEDFIPVSSTLNALQEVLVDFSGETLNTPAQLSIPATALDPTHTFLLAKVERPDGVPRMVAAALARINGANLMTVASPGLPGLVQGGEYVFYDITAPVGFAQGVVSTSAGPVQAVVQSDSLPIADITEADGRYIVPALAGTVNLSATVPHTNLIGSVSAPAVAGQTVVANITLAGTVTNAVLSPADGSLGVPASIVITVTTTAPLNAQSIQQANLVLLKSGAPVALQSFVLSNSGTVLSFAPQKNLDPATQYTVHVSGLADIFGGAVIVPQSTFTTKAVAPPNFNPNAITFSFPDANGNIHVSAPAGSLPPGTRVMIIDQTNGLVLSLTALNDGSISGDFLGTVNDLLQITVTDPNGATASFTRSQFVAPDGTVAVGPGGGTVTGTGGVELRIPDGALDKAASFKIEAFGPDLFPDRPPLDNANFGGGLKIESQDKPTFNKEIKLAFPKPSDAPDGAFYYVYRRLQGPDGGVIYETLDHAFVEGEGANAKVVTASPPFPGYGNSLGAYKIDPLGAVLLESVFVNDVILMWTFNSQLPGLPLPGAVAGKVLRPRFIPGQPGPVFDPVPGVTVVPLDSNSRPIYDRGLGTTQSDGKFTLFAPFFVGGTVGVQACDPVGGKCYQAKAFEVSVIDTKTIFDFVGPLFKYYHNVAATNITFAPLPPAQPAPQLFISVAQRNADGSVSPVNGIIQAGTTLVVSVKTNAGAGSVPTVTGGTIQGQNFGVKPDPSDSTSFIFEPDFVVPQPGTYKITATALPPLGGNAITASYAFLAIGPGGSNSNVVNDQPPDVVTGALAPQPGAKSVSTTTFPQIVFTEPVNNVASNLSLQDLGSVPQGADCDYSGGGALVPIKLSGIAVTFSAQNNPVNVPVDSITDSHNVTSVTVIPQTGMKFNTCYKVSLQNGITDLDKDIQGNPAPKHLVGTPPARDFGFQTFGPEQLASAGNAPSPRVGIIGNKAYTVQPLGSVNSSLMQYDITDPTAPSGPVMVTGLPGRAMDLGVEETSPDTGGGLVAVATGAGILPMPSNIFFYDARDPGNVKRIGAVSVTGSAGQEGTILKMVLKDSFAYTSTHRKGVQVVDIRRAIANYTAAVQSDIVQFGFQVSQDGVGFGRDAVVNTIDVQTTKFGGSFSAALFDLKAGNYVLDPQSDPQGQTLVLATGMEALAVVDPLGGQVIAQLSDLSVSGATLVQGSAIALGLLGAPCPSGTAFNLLTCNVAVVGGRSASGGGVLVLVDLTDPRNPVPVSSVHLAEVPTDVVMKDNLALVGLSNQVQIIDFTSPGNPQLAGSIAGVGGKLTLTDSGLLFSTGLLTSQAGLHVSTFQPTVVIPPVAPVFSSEVVSNNQTYIQTLVKLTLNPRVIAAEPTSGVIEIFDGAVKIAERTFQFVKNTGEIVFDKGLQFVTDAATGSKKFFTAKITAFTNRGPLESQRKILAAGMHIMLDFNNDTVIDKDDETAKQKGEAFAFWEADTSFLNNTVVATDPPVIVPQTPEQDAEQLIDFARVRIIVNALPDVTTAKAYLKLKGVKGWQLMRNVGITDAMTTEKDKAAAAKLYLSDKKVSLQQVDVMKKEQSSCDDPNDNVLNSNCYSNGHEYISLTGLTSGKTYDLLFRCTACPKDITRTMSILVRDNSLLGSSTDGDTVNVDIRPIKDWVGAYSARESDPPGPAMVPVDGWSNQLPSGANVTVLVHGFKVSKDDALNSFIPKYTKRLYWSGHWVLPAQNYDGTDENYPGAKVYTVGLLWHGDVNSPVSPFQVTKGLYFPDDEFRALQSGIPFANFFNRLASNGNTTTVIAHSLGNMAVNSALTRPDLPKDAVKQYMMNDAAVSLEAFSTSDVFGAKAQIPANSERFQPNVFKQNREVLLQSHLLQQGYPDDTIWNNLLQQVLALPSDPTCINGPDGQLCQPTAHGIFDAFYNARPIPDRNTHYKTRWSKQRPGKVAPVDGSLQTGPWNGFFAGNIGKTDLYNSYNYGDCVLNNSWFANQMFQKPDRDFTASISDATYAFSHRFGGPFPVDMHTNASDNNPDTVHSSTDSLDNQSWLNREPPFPTGLLGDINSHYGIHRQWAELAYWYPSRSGPVGISDGILSDGTKVFAVDHVLDFTAVGELDTATACFSRDSINSTSDTIGFLTQLGDHTETHSYMLDKPFWQTWWAYKQYFLVLDKGPNRPDPDPPATPPSIH